MHCPRCQSEKYVKDGIVSNRQRYKCKVCHYHFTVPKRRAKPAKIKRIALQLHLEGVGFRALERVLNVSNVAIMKWINSYGDKVKQLKKDKTKVKITDLKEIQAYINQKEKVEGYGLLVIDMDDENAGSFWVKGDLKEKKE
ncbi:MAG: hypothetical protein AAFX87_26050 [Bacteroidota bacterium]